MILAVTNRPPMMWSIIFVAIFVLIFGYRLLRLYIIGPLRSRGRPIKAAFDRTEISLEEIPSPAKESVIEIAQMLAAAGFTAALHLRSSNPTPNTDGYESVWLSTSDETIASILVTQLRREKGPRTRIMCGFATELDDGTSISTSNSGSQGVFVRNPRVDSVRWPGVKPLEFLLQLHRARVARLKGSRSAIPPVAKEMAAKLEREHRETMERQVTAGYFWHDTANYVYRSTLKGAFLMRWRLLRPWKEIAYSRNERKLRTELDALGLKR